MNVKSTLRACQLCSRKILLSNQPLPDTTRSNIFTRRTVEQLIQYVYLKLIIKHNANFFFDNSNKKHREIVWYGSRLARAALFSAKLAVCFVHYLLQHTQMVKFGDYGKDAKGK